VTSLLQSIRKLGKCSVYRPDETVYVLSSFLYYLTHNAIKLFWACLDMVLLIWSQCELTAAIHLDASITCKQLCLCCESHSWW
jgi:hypothetical protein